MKVRYDKLWRLMKDNKMKKSDLSKAAEISSYAMTKLNNDRPVSMEVMYPETSAFNFQGAFNKYRGKFTEYSSVDSID